MALLTYLNEQPLLVPLLLLSITIFLLHRISSHSKKLHAPLPPSPPGLPILGNLHQIGALPHRSLAALATKHGPLILLQLGQVPTLIVSSAEAAREIMKTNNLIFSSRPPFKVAKSVLYGGADMAFAPYNEYWRNVRKLCVTRLLSAKMVQTFQQIREEEVNVMMDNISRESSTVNMTVVLNTFVNDILCRVVSHKFSCDKVQKKIIRELVQETSALFGTFHVGDYIPYLGWVDSLLGLDARARRCSKGWDDVFDKVIDDNGQVDRISGGDKDEDLVDVLVSFQKNPSMGFQQSKENIKALLVDVLAAGTDPPYITLEWAMTELVQNCEIMNKLQQEVRGIASGKAKIQEEDLSQMSYLKCVLKEVLRLHPPVPLLVPRELMEECHIQGYRIPSKARVIVNEWAISRDPKFWEAPEEFRPDRFINNPIDYKGNDFQFIPFGAGRRICPGMNFAMAITELALANLVNQFQWEFPPGMKIQNVDMTEAPGLASRKMQKLELLAELYPF